MSNKRLTATQPAAPTPKNDPADRATVELLRQKIADKVAERPDKAAVILTEWLKFQKDKKAG